MEQRKFRMPTAYTILFCLIILVAATTWFIPAGSYDYADGIPISGSYHAVAPTPQGIGAALKAAFRGFYDAVDVCVFILMVGGFLGVVMKTGAIDAGVSNVISRLQGRENLLITILMLFFGLGGTTYGMWEETMAFFPLLLPIFLAAGYDAVVGVAVILLGAGAGVIASTVNPFATGIAAGFAGVSLGDGILWRIIQFVLFEGIAIWYVSAYAARVKRDPSRSVVGIGAGRLHADVGRVQPLTRRHAAILLIFAATFLTMIYGVIPFDEMGLPLPVLGWWFPELSALFLVAGIVVGLMDRLSEVELAETFVSGCTDLLGVAFIIGISRGITVLMNDGRHHSSLGRDGPLRPWLHLLRAAGLFDLPAPVRADSVLLRSGHTVRAGGGSAGTVRRGGRRRGGDGLPVRLRSCESGDAYRRRGDGRAGAGPHPL